MENENYVPDASEDEKAKLKAEKSERAAKIKAEKAEKAALLKAEKAQRAAKLRAEKANFEGAELRIRENIQSRLEMLMGSGSGFDEPRSIQDVADGTGISRAAIRKYTLCTKGGADAAVPSAVALCKIADYFGVTPNYLLGYGEPEDAEKQLRELDSASRFTGFSRETVKTLEKAQEAAGNDDALEAALAVLDSAVRAAAGEIIRRAQEKSR